MNEKIQIIKTESINAHRDIVLVKNIDTGKFAALRRVEGKFNHDVSFANSPEYTTVNWVTRQTANRNFAQLVENYRA